MNINQITQTTQRHADTFTAGASVFEASSKGKLVKVWVEETKSQTGNSYKRFAVYVNGSYTTSTSNYPKAIGIAMLKLTEE